MNHKYINSKTFEIIDDVFEVDEDIAEAISILNKKGYYTKYCCSGHVKDPRLYESYPLEKVENKKWNIDTVLINKIMLQNVGLKPENIVDSGICSVCNSDIIHSYRIEKKDYKTETAIIELQ